MAVTCLRNEIYYLIEEKINDTPVDKWKFHVNGGENCDVFGDKVQAYFILKETQYDEDDDETYIEQIELQTILMWHSSDDQDMYVDEARVFYKCQCDDKMIGYYDGPIYDLSIIDILLLYNPQFKEYIKERTAEKYNMAYDYIYEKLTEDTAKWLIAFHEDDDALNFGITVDPDYYILGRLDPYDDDKDIVGLRKGNIIEVGLYPIDESYEDSYAPMTIRELLLDDIRKGKAPEDYYENQIQEWVGELEESFELDEVYSIDIRDFVIRTTGYWCVHHNHTLDRIKAVIKVLTPSGEVINLEAEAMYCEECNEYYITESEYERLRRFGTLCHKVVTEKEYIKAKGDYSKWAEKSTLRSYGYNASEKDDLSDDERQAILAFVITNDIMKVDEVISFIEWLVRNRGSKYKNAEAKWLRDLSYIRNSKTLKNVINVGSIYRKEYIKYYD